MTEIIFEEEGIYSKISKLLKESIDKILSEKEKVLLGLPGGRSVPFIFKYLKDELIEWEKIHVFMVGERLVSIEDDDNVTCVIEAKKWPSILGPEDFLDWVKGKYYESKNDEEIPQSRMLDPSQKLILEVVCEYYAVDEKDLYKSRRGSYNEPRNISIYLIRRFRREPTALI